MASYSSPTIGLCAVCLGDPTVDWLEVEAALTLWKGTSTCWRHVRETVAEMMKGQE